MNNTSPDMNSFPLVLKMEILTPSALLTLFMMRTYMTARRKYSEAMGRYMDAFCMDPDQPLSALVLGTHTIFLRSVSICTFSSLHFTPHSFFRLFVNLFITLIIYESICDIYL